MTRPGARYRYVGPVDLLALVDAGATGTAIASPEDFTAWAAARTGDELAEPFTYVVPTDGVLRLAPRRSEHVVCAGGAAVSAAGEITFAAERGRRSVTEVSNQSTGYCPDVTCWPAVAAALDRAGLAHPGRLTVEVVFRRCPACAELNIVREGDFVCVFCDADLPGEWNVDPGA